MAGARPSEAAHAVDRDCTACDSRNLKDNFTIVANTILTCPVVAVGCANARAGSGAVLDNNSFVMGYVDVDADAGTFDSSSAALSLPADASRSSRRCASPRPAFSAPG